MARVHKWYFLVNQAGEPIENSEVYITLAGTGGKTGVAAWVYFDEFGAAGSRDLPQMTTLENGYFEFWIDEDEDFDVCNTAEIDASTATSYGFDQKFRIDWDKTNIHSGWIDYVDVFPANRYFQAADLTKCSNTNMNKVISSYLACKWDQHSDEDAREENSLPIHGFEFVRVNEKDTLKNKIINNYLGWLWTDHVKSTLQDYTLSGDYSPPHDFWPVNPNASINDGDYSTFNKIMSNELYINLQNQIDETRAGLFDIGSNDWVIDGDGNRTFLLNHGLDIEYPHVTCYDSIENVMIKTAVIGYEDVDVIRVTIGTVPMYMKVRVTT